jgi:hypothetical protein
VTSEHQAIVSELGSTVPFGHPNGPVEPSSDTIAWCSEVTFLLVYIKDDIMQNYDKKERK